MRKFRTAQMLGIGVLTPALTGTPQQVGARSLDAAHDVKIDGGSEAALEAAQVMMASTVIGLSLAEKLQITSDRIPLSGNMLLARRCYPPNPCYRGVRPRPTVNCPTIAGRPC